MHRSCREQTIESCDGSRGEWCSLCGGDQNHICISYRVTYVCALEQAPNQWKSQGESQ